VDNEDPRGVSRRSTAIDRYAPDLDEWDSELRQRGSIPVGTSSAVIA
jgi:hypothetical protein